MVQITKDTSILIEAQLKLIDNWAGTAFVKGDEVDLAIEAIHKIIGLPRQLTLTIATEDKNEM